LKTGNCLITNGNEEKFDIDGNQNFLSSPEQKLKSIALWGPQKSEQLSELKIENGVKAEQIRGYF